MGEISYLVETVEKTPEQRKKGIKKVEAMANCVGDQVKSFYKVLENMRQARNCNFQILLNPRGIMDSAPARNSILQILLYWKNNST